MESVGSLQPTDHSSAPHLDKEASAKTPQMDLMKLYEQVCINIRTSDDISFKLLGIVPLLAGTGVTLLSKSNIVIQPHPWMVLLVSAVGAVLTFGLFKWELRNVQKCTELIKVAAALENELFGRETERTRILGQYQWLAGSHKKPEPPLFGKIDDEGTSYFWNKTRIGKTRAERLIYWASIFAWFLPVVMAFAK